MASRRFKSQQVVCHSSCKLCLQGHKSKPSLEDSSNQPASMARRHGDWRAIEVSHCATIFSSCHLFLTPHNMQTSQPIRLHKYNTFCACNDYLPVWRLASGPITKSSSLCLWFLSVVGVGQHLLCDLPSRYAVQGRFKGIMVVVTPCRSDRSTLGLLPYCHLNDGRLHLILIRDCSRLQYLKFLASIPVSGARLAILEELPRVLDPKVWSLASSILDTKQRP